MNPADYKLQQTTRATSLEDIDYTLSQQPLIDPEDIKAFYRPELNETRGGDQVGHLRVGLTQAYKKHTFFKASVMGHPGVGKSTELSRLVGEIQEQFRPLRFSADKVLDPGSFRPLDVLLIMMIEVAQRTAEVVQPPSSDRLQEIWSWFSVETETIKRATASTAQIEAGAGIKADSMWGKVSGLFATLRGEIKFASTRETTITEYRLSRLDTLIDAANNLLDECNQLLRDADRQEWLFIGEDFDKPHVSREGVEELFIKYNTIFRRLRTHLIFSIPIELHYSDKSAELPFEENRSFLIPDTPVYHQDHTPNEKGRLAVKEVLAARMDLELFEPDQMMRLIVASGGNIRDLFVLVNFAATNALVRSSTSEKMHESDVTSAIYNLRSSYERRLGQSVFNRDPITYSEKAELLKRIYQGEKDAQIPNPALYSLLSARAVQEFNGQRWFGVHPLVVDILAAQEKLVPPVTGGVVNGGTQLN
jgi:hypothetical protein